MSHAKERKEKNCLNCESEVAGKYCQHCGQENIETKETFWGLVTHFIHDITHFDGKFFSTLKLLLFKPGFLSKEYIKGKRASYLHPIRMYVFTSAFFFIIFFTLFTVKGFTVSESEKLLKEKEKINQAIENVNEGMLNHKDSVIRNTAGVVLKTLHQQVADIDKAIQQQSEIKKERQDKAKKATDSLNKKLKPATGSENTIKEDTIGPLKVSVNQGFETLKSREVEYSSPLSYALMQKNLPKAYRDNWFKRLFLSQTTAAVYKGNKDGNKFIENVIDYLFHSFPKMLFISLPLFALFLQWLYFRRKDLLYADHAIYAIHLYCATFVFMLAFFALSKINDQPESAILGLLQFALVCIIYIYQYKSMCVFYQQSRMKTILKFILINSISLIMMTILLVLFFTLGAYQAASSTQ